MGSVVLSGVCVFKSGLSTTIGVSLIVAPDSKGDMVASTFGRSQLNFLSAYSVVCVEYVDVFC